MESLNFREAIILMAQRRPRGIQTPLAVGLLAAGMAFFTFGTASMAPVETWYVLTMNASLAAIFIIWYAIKSIGAGAMRLRAQGNIRRMRDGETLVRWRYAPDEWERFAADEYARDRRISLALTPVRRIVLTALGFGGFVAAMMALVAVSAASSGQANPYPGPVIPSVVGFAVLLPLAVMAFQALNYYMGDRAMQRARRTAPEIRMNAHGADGLPQGYFAFRPGNTSAHIAPDAPQILCITVIHTVSGRTGRIPLPRTERILIPRGHEAEARAFAARSFR